MDVSTTGLAGNLLEVKHLHEYLKETYERRKEKKMDGPVMGLMEWEWSNGSSSDPT